LLQTLCMADRRRLATRRANLAKIVQLRIAQQQRASVLAHAARKDEHLARAHETTTTAMLEVAVYRWQAAATRRGYDQQHVASTAAWLIEQSAEQGIAQAATAQASAARAAAEDTWARSVLVSDIAIDRFRGASRRWASILAALHDTALEERFLLWRGGER
jgi:hypothetical protein